MKLGVDEGRQLQRLCSRERNSVWGNAFENTSMIQQRMSCSTAKLRIIKIPITLPLHTESHEKVELCLLGGTQLREHIALFYTNKLWIMCLGLWHMFICCSTWIWVVFVFLFSNMLTGCIWMACSTLLTRTTTFPGCFIRLLLSRCCLVMYTATLVLPLPVGRQMIMFLSSRAGRATSIW